MKTKFLYHAEAVAASGHLTLPVQEQIEIQASVALPHPGGIGSACVQKFCHRNIVSFDRAESNVVGSYSELDKAHGTLSSVVIEGLNVLNMVTCDRLVMRLTSKHSDDGGEPSFIVLGSHFDNLRIAGIRVDVPLAMDVFSEHSTWSKLGEGYRDEKKRRDLKSLSLIDRADDQVPVSRGMVGFSLSRIPDSLPGGLTRSGHGIYVPHFGTVYIGRLWASQGLRRISMLDIHLGCSVEGCAHFGGGEANGSFWP